MKKLVFSIMIILVSVSAFAESKVLTLTQSIRIANDSSLQSFRARNQYQYSSWQFKSFRAARLPSVKLTMTPVSYNRYIRQRYNSEENIDVYRAQQMYSAGGLMSVNQNVDFLGGQVYLESGIDYMRNFGDYAGNQFSAIPIRFGYSQSLIGYNQFKWDKKIEPLRYERSKKELLKNMEGVAETAVNYYFDLALAQADYNLAVNNLRTSDTLCVIGERRFKIQSISEADFLTLKLDRMNAQNAVENARISVKRAMFSLASFLGMDPNTEIEVILPAAPAVHEISVDFATMQARLNNPDIMQQRQNVIEAERDLSRLLAESRFNANINASIGFNQVSNSLGGVFTHPLRQDLVSLSVSIPLLDWGLKKGQVNMARNNLNVAQIAQRQQELDTEEDVITTVNDFNIQQHLVASAIDALELANVVFESTSQRFLIGKSDLNSITLSQSRRQTANNNYIRALHNYWLSYYRLRKLTLYDFNSNRMIDLE